MSGAGAARPCQAKNFPGGGTAALPRQQPPFLRTLWLIPAIGSLVLAVPAGALGADWRTELSITERLTATDNVRLAPRGREESDVILETVPGLRLSGQGARLKLDANYAPGLYLYADSSDLNKLYNNLSSTASLEAIDDFFFIDARGNISQQFLSPFGAQPRELGPATDNRTEVRSVGLSPYLRGRIFGETTYLFRNDSTWTDTTARGTRDSYSNNVTGRVENTVATIGWALEYSRSDTRFEDANYLTTELARARLIYRVSPQLSVNASAGYEENNYALTTQSGSIYGGGFSWRPTERTNLSANYEERFFGSSYSGNFDHRTPLTALRLSASRDVSTYPQLAQTLPQGNTAELLNAIFAARIPDPVARQAAVEQFIRLSGLPAFLVGPQAFYTERVFLQQPVQGSFAILGARNVVTLTASRTHSEAISGATGAPVPDVFAFSSRFVQSIVTADWAHRLTPLSSVNLLASRIDTDGREPTNSDSTQNLVRLTWTMRLGPRTDGSLGVRYTLFDSDVAPDHREAAVFGSLAHRF